MTLHFRLYRECLRHFAGKERLGKVRMLRQTAFNLKFVILGKTRKRGIFIIEYKSKFSHKLITLRQSQSLSDEISKQL
jgi:hypothetical protein